MDQCHRRVPVKVDLGGRGTCGTIGTLSHLLFNLNHHEHVQYVHSRTEEDKKFGVFIYLLNYLIFCSATVTTFVKSLLHYHVI